MRLLIIALLLASCATRPEPQPWKEFDTQDHKFLMEQFKKKGAT